MNEHKLYDLRYFEPVILKQSHAEFLQAFQNSLVWGMRLQTKADTQLDFCLLLQMLHWEINVSKFRQMQERLETYHGYEKKLKEYGHSLFSAIRNRKKMNAAYEEMQKIPMMITLQEMATLAATFYYLKNWGMPEQLKRELEMTTI